MNLALLIATLLCTPSVRNVQFYGGDADDEHGGLSCERNTSVSDGRIYEDFDIQEISAVSGLWGNYLLSSFIPKYAYYEIRKGVRQGNGGVLLVSGEARVEVLRTGRMLFGLTELLIRCSIPDVTLSPGRYFLTLAPIGYGYGRAFANLTVGRDEPPAWDPNPPPQGTPIGNGNSFFDSKFYGIDFFDTENVLGRGTWDFSFGVGNLDTCAPSLSLADTFTVTRGVHQSGVLEDIFGTDDRRVVIQQRRYPNIASPNAQLVTETAIPCPPSQRLLVTIESQCTGQPSSRILQRTELFNFGDQRWETVDERVPSSSDATFQVSIDINPARFAEPGTNVIRTRLSWFDRGTTSLNWNAGIDYLLWAVP